MTRKLPTQERLRELFDYNAKTGRLCWKERRGTAPAGSAAGCLAFRGPNETRPYWRVVVDLKPCCHADLVWVWHNGAVPHRLARADKDPVNDRIENLRIRSPKRELAQDELRSMFLYDAATGLFSRRDTGSPAGFSASNGYVTISIFERAYRAHRLAWFYVHGVWPKYIDHIDGNRHNNAIANLRDVSMMQNAHNARKPSHNTSGVKGVCFDRLRQKWKAQLKVKRRTVWQQSFVSKDEAIAAVRAARERIHGEFARHD